MATTTVTPANRSPSAHCHDRTCLRGYHCRPPSDCGCLSKDLHNRRLMTSLRAGSMDSVFRWSRPDGTTESGLGLAACHSSRAAAYLLCGHRGWVADAEDRSTGRPETGRTTTTFRKSSTPGPGYGCLHIAVDDSCWPGEILPCEHQHTTFLDLLAGVDALAGSVTSAEVFSLCASTHGRGRVRAAAVGSAGLVP